VRSQLGRTAVHGRLPQETQISRLHSFVSSSSRPSTPLYAIPLRSQFLPDEIRTLGSFSTSRSFHIASPLRSDNQTKPKTGEAQEGAAKSESTESDPAKNPEESAKEGSSQHAKQEGEGEGESKEQGEGEGEGKKGEQKEAPPPPPPHGDKSPWQVFTETLQSEFKASKEWNESTKALAAGAQQFSENESVRRARQAYESTTGKVTSTTANVLKSTAGAVGKGAAWTWETPVVKGVRTTVNATASVIEKGTRPIRETEAFKNVKNVIDDGSSSRYGGWVEKEERRKAREFREMQEAQANGGTGRRAEVAKEDPK
jgi:import inner membrane translocase subunit TIM44